MVTPEIQIEWAPKKLTRDGETTLKIGLEIPKGIHVQAHKPAEELLIPTKISLKEGGGLTFGQPIYPEPEKLPTSWSSVALLVYEGKIDILVPTQVTKVTRPGKYLVKGSLTFQGCTTQACLPPKQQEFALTLDVL